MARVFPFTTMLRKNMIDKDKPDLYYAIAKASGEIDIDELAERVQRASTVKGHLIVGARIRFRPGQELLKAMNL